MLVLFLTSVSYCQNDYTVLDEKTYNTIKFDGVFFADIKATNADIDKLNELLLNTAYDPFGKGEKATAVNIELNGYEIGEEQRVFNYNSELMIAFSREENSTEYVIVRLESTNITVNGTKLKIGDPISNLKGIIDYKIAIGSYDNKFVSIIFNNNYSAPISIDLDDKNRITEILYYEAT